MSKYGISSDEERSFSLARILVFGVGGGGGNAVSYMVRQGINGVSFACANTDRQALDSLDVPNKIQLGERGLGAGGNPEVGRAEAENNEDAIRAILADYDMVFVTAGMGGGTGTGAAPVVARLAQEMNKLVVAVVTTPFSYEGGRRRKAAKIGIEQLMMHVNSIITIPNDKLEQIYGNMDVVEAFGKSNDILLHAVKGLIDILRSEGVINMDFEDVRAVMSTRGYAMMGIGRASGEDRARQAAEKAIRSPLLDDLQLKNAQSIMVNIVSSSPKMGDSNEVAQVLRELADPEESDFYYGITVNHELGDEMEVTVIATGLVMDETPKNERPKPAYNPPPAPTATQAPTPQPPVSAPAPAPQPRSTSDAGTSTFSLDQFLRNKFH